VGGSEIEYRLPDGEFGSLQAQVGIEDGVAEGVAVRLVVAADQRALFDEVVTAGDEPRTLSLDVHGARRLTILVESGQIVESCEYLNLCDARLLP
jgi:hypothetical protein